MTWPLYPYLGGLGESVYSAKVDRCLESLRLLGTEVSSGPEQDLGDLGSTPVLFPEFGLFVTFWKIKFTLISEVCTVVSVRTSRPSCFTKKNCRCW